MPRTIRIPTKNGPVAVPAEKIGQLAMLLRERDEHLMLANSMLGAIDTARGHDNPSTGAPTDLTAAALLLEQAIEDGAHDDGRALTDGEAMAIVIEINAWLHDASPAELGEGLLELRKALMDHLPEPPPLVTSV